MIPTRKKLIELAETATRESKYLDFKRQFDTTTNEAWCEIIKDIIAMANSGGGIIVLGIEDDGTDAEMDRDPVLKLDTAESRPRFQNTPVISLTKWK